ncbi:hypothetical protein ACFYWY_04060 [Streptomyces sp. NPDC002870]|uniref:hypothetical protein n=1 Tax=Streptomyces sp. NPDC002870 TaxID=3364666 RepID=UPI0036B5457A
MNAFTMICPNHQGGGCWACDGKGYVTFTGENADRAADTLARIDRWATRREQERHEEG